MIKVKERDFGRLKIDRGRLIVNLDKQRQGKLRDFLEKVRENLKPICKAKINLRQRDLVSEIWSIFYNSQIRKSLRWQIVDVEEELKRQIKKYVEKEEPIKLVFIAWPFKMGALNPLKTSRTYPDLGEVAFVKRLLEIDLSVKQVYPPGVRWKVLLEGKAYQEMMKASTEDIRKYKEGMNFFLEILDRERIISTVELADVVAPYKEEIKKKMKEYRFFMNNSNDEVYRKYVFHTMWWSISVAHYPLEKLLAIYYGYGSIDEATVRKLEKEAMDTALEYLAFNKVKNLVGRKGVIKDSFPDWIYVSITDKMGKYAFHPIHEKTRYFPHHGVPVVRKKRVDIGYLAEILACLPKERFQAVYLEDDFEEEPFFYLDREK